MPTSIRDLLRRDHESALELLRRVGVARTRKLLAGAQRDLERRIDEAVRGPGKDSFTAVQLRATLAQVRAVTRDVQRGVRDVILEGAGVASERAADNLARYLEAANRAFSGTARPLGLDRAAMVDAATVGVRSTMLRRLASSGTRVPGADPEPHPAKMGILDRYGIKTIGHFEDVLRRGLVTRATFGEMRDQIRDASPFLRGAPMSWATRITRTELHGAYQRGGHEAIQNAAEQVDDMLKIVTATFDNRTAPDSFNQHGCCRLPDEPFEYVGSAGESIFYLHPPDRPQDRSVVVAHRASWPMLTNLRPLADEAVQRAFVRNKTKFHRRPLLVSPGAQKLLDRARASEK